MACIVVYEVSLCTLERFLSVLGMLTTFGLPPRSDLFRMFTIVASRESCTKLIVAMFNIAYRIPERDILATHTTVSKRSPIFSPDRI